MKELYESINLIDLRAMAVNRGIKGVSGLKKSEIVQLMLDKDEEEKAAKAELAA